MLAAFKAWLVDNWPSLVLTISLYAAWNVAKRPPPTSRPLYLVWRLCEFLMLLPWDRLGGPLKPLLGVWPPHDLEQAAPAALPPPDAPVMPPTTRPARDDDTPPTPRNLA